jgi:hypothetical protein
MSEDYPTPKIGRIPDTTKCACGCGRHHLNTHIKRAGEGRFLWFLTMNCLNQWTQAHASDR